MHLIEAHPYEEVAYDIYSLENDNVDYGLGCTGDLAEPLSGNDFLRPCFVSVRVAWNPLLRSDR